MHDQKKRKHEIQSPEAEAAAAVEHERVGALYTSVLTAHKNHLYSNELLADSEALLTAVPEAYTAYNYRRLALEAMGREMPATKDAEAPGDTTQKIGATAEVKLARSSSQEWLRKELQLNSRVLLLNYKNYNAFLHRHWIFKRLEMLATEEAVQATGACSHPTATMTSSASEAAASPDAENALIAASPVPTYDLLCSLLQKERSQCEQLLQLDERNFHAWNYRRWVMEQESRTAQLRTTYLLLGHSPSPIDGYSAESSAAPSHENSCEPVPLFSPAEVAELRYTNQKIRNNFSNYSAWHQRSLAIQSAVKRWQPQQAEGDGSVFPSDVREQQPQTSWRAALLSQVREDIGFLEQAVYCDPNDQSAWFYAPFIFQLLRSHYVDSDTAAAVALEGRFVNAVVDLVAEAERAGTEHECYLPYHFLLDQFILLQDASLAPPNAGCTSSTVSPTWARDALGEYASALCAKVPSLSVDQCEEKPGASAPGGEDGGTSSRLRCFRFLHARLRQADVLRCCLYDDLLQRALQGVQSQVA